METFSATHPYNMECLVEVFILDGVDDGEALCRAELMDFQVDDNVCPRCRETLTLDGVPPAGSRVSPCRCIPVCPACGVDEGATTISPLDWPLAPEGVRARVAQYESAASPATIVVGDPDDPSADQVAHLLDGEGVLRVWLRPHPGGWAEFGLDEERP